MRVMLVDDAPLVREGIARLLADTGIQVVHQRNDALGLSAAVDTHRPNVVVLDVRMPPTHTTEGIVAAKVLKDQHPNLGILLLSQHIETRHALEVLRNGRGVGYLLKERVARPAELATAIRRVADGGSVVDPEVVRAVVETRRFHDPLQQLSKRERAVLGLIAEGLSNRSIAERLDLTEHTVEAHVRSLFNKLKLPPDTSSHRRVLAVLTLLRARSGGSHDQNPQPHHRSSASPPPTTAPAQPTTLPRTPPR